MKDSNGSKNNDNKDRRLREKKDTFRDQVGLLVSKMLGDTDYGKRNWDNKIDLVKELREKLDDPVFVQKWHGQLMENKSSSSDINKAGLEDHAYEIPGSSHGYIPQNLKGGLQIKDKALQELKEQTQLCGEKPEQTMNPSEQMCLSFLEDVLAQSWKEATAESPSFAQSSESFVEELKQILDALEEKYQIFKEAKAETFLDSMVQKMLDLVPNGAACDILNQDCATQVLGQFGVQINGEQLRFRIPVNPNSIPVNEKGKSAEIFDQEIAAEKQGNEVSLSFQLSEGKVTELNLDMRKINQAKVSVPAGNSGNDWDLESFLPPELADILRDVTVQSNKQSYKVHPKNAELLKEIFQGHPEIDENFQIAHPDFRSNFMDSLVEIYRNMEKGNQDMLEIEDFKNMDVKIQDMEKNGLQVTWLRERLEKAWNRLEREKKKRKIRERMKKDEEELAELEKEDS